jgi:hypothetical protein
MKTRVSSKGNTLRNIVAYLSKARTFVDHE